MENTNKVAELIENALKENKSLLIQALPGSGKNHLTKKSAEKVGLILAEFDLDSRTLTGFPKEEKEINAASITQEDAIVASLKDKNANAILLNTTSGDNIDFYINVAKKTNMPLIVSNTTNEFFLEIDVKAFDNVEALKSVFEAIKPLKVKDEPMNPKIYSIASNTVLDRLKMIRLDPQDLATTDKPKVK